MPARSCSTLSALVLAASLGPITASAAVLTDDFNGPAGPPNPLVWNTAGTGAGTTTIDGNGNLFANNGTFNTGHSQRTWAVTTASDFDPFTAPLRIELDGIAVGGDPGQTQVAGSLLFGRAATDTPSNYYPNGGAMAFGAGLFLRKNAANEYNILFHEFTDNVGGGTAVNSTLALTGTPTGLTLELDGVAKTATVILEGATYTDGNTASKTYPLADFTLANLTTNGTYIGRIAVGAFNYGAVIGGTLTGTATGATFTVDSINVVPEPATASLALAGLMLFAGRARRG